MSPGSSTVVLGGDPKHLLHDFQPAGQNMFDAPLGICACGARLYADAQVSNWTLNDWLDRLESKGGGYVTFAIWIDGGKRYRCYLTNDSADHTKRYPLYGQGRTRAEAASDLLSKMAS